MRRLLQRMSIPLAFTGLLLAAGMIPVRAQTKSPGVVQGTVLVKFAPSMEAALQTMSVARKNGVLQTGLPRFDAVATRHKAYALKRVFPYHPQKEATHRKHGLHLWYEVSMPLTADVALATRDFKSLKDVATAEPVRAKAMIQPGKPTVIPEATPSAISGPVNDPLYFMQWHYENDGTHGGIVEGDINLAEAWRVQSGKPNVVVCVHDLGIDVVHRDLAPNVWVNSVEKNGRPGVDDDYNGYVDDIHGYDFSDDSGTIPPGDHGTHVAGTIAAVTNNGIGVAGIAGGDGVHNGVKVMSAKVLAGTYDNIAASYVYAADNGAVISQNSWGYTVAGVYEQSVLDAIDYFIEEAGNFPNSPMKGGIVIFAAGNSGVSDPYYPGYYNKVLTVASLGRNNARAYYSNYGPHVDIAAPGGDQFNNFEDGVLSTLPGNQYGFFQGTSMACPHVSGIAALVVSQNGGPGYKPSDLWTALTTGTHDINAYNPDHIDQLGVGYVDAALALKTNQKIAPAKITDLAVAEIAQDFLGLTWTATADTDDGTAARFEIVYGRDSLDVVRRKNIKSVIVPYEGEPGAQVQASVPDLYVSTRYYVAVHALDRWGNASVISNIVKATTTEGPSVSVDKESLTFTIDTNEGTVAADNFSILNANAGELRWKGEVRQRDFFLDWNALSLPYPKTSRAAGTPAPKMSLRKSTLRLNAKRPRAGTLGYFDDYEQREISYTDYIYFGNYMIGEEDLTIPNSAATKFTVAHADGFNLTSIRMLLNHNEFRGDAPFIVEIFRGEAMEQKNLVYAAQYNGYTDFDEVYNVQLDHQLFFAQGTTFWVAVHMPAGHRYPLGVGEESQEDFSDNCYISFDVGKSWLTLPEVIGNDHRWVWVHVAVSANPSLEQYLTLSPVEGTVAGKDDMNVDVTADATRLINGTYNADVVMLNNDFDHQLARLPVTVTVSGQKPALSSDAIVNFGSQFTGTTKEITVPLKNTGFGNFTIESATVDHADFEVTGNPGSVKALGESALVIQYTPAAVGAGSGVVTLADAAGNKHVIQVTGVGIAPSEISVAPATASYTLALGEGDNGSFTISNTGNYPLQFFLPKYSDGAGIDYVDEGFNKYGYTFRTSQQPGSGLAYSWEDISGTGKDISEFFQDVISNAFYPVNLGFEFPIFDQVTDKMMITRYGMLTLDDRVNIVGNPLQMGSEYMPYGYISGMNMGLNMTTGGKVYYQAKAGKFIVQYENAGLTWDDAQRVTFQIIVYDNGNTVINYKDLSTLDAFNKQYFGIGIEDPDKRYGYLISDFEHPVVAVETGTSVEIVSPGRDILKNLSVTSATLALGESVEVTYDVNTDALTEGNFWQNLVIVSNDPVHPAASFKALVNITSGGTPDVAVSTEALDLGEVFVGDDITSVIQVRNAGTKGITVQSITSDDGNFALTFDAVPFLLKPRSSLYIHVKLQGVTAGVVEDNIHIALSDGTQKHVSVTGTVMPPPSLALVYEDPISDVLNAGEVATHTVSVTNDGLSDLQVVPVGNAWAYFKDVLAEGEAAGTQYPENDYAWTSSTQPGGPAYSWEEIKDTGMRLEEIVYDPLISEEQAIELPFPFRFYGKEYTTVYVNPKGVLSFTPGQEVLLFPAATIPTTEAPNNFIAAYWSNGIFDNFNGARFGIFYKEGEEVVTFEFLGVYNLFSMGDPFDLQVLLYKNGNIKFQYKLSAGFSPAHFGVVGLENEDGSDGVRLAAFENFIIDRMAVLLSPANRVTLAPGESKDLTLVVDASHLMAGTYSTEALLHTNVPGKLQVGIPVALEVIGAPMVEAPEAIDLGDVLVNTEEQAVYTKDFAIQNTGAAILDITALKMKDGSAVTLWQEAFDPWWGEYYWVEVPAELAPGDISMLPRETRTFRVQAAPLAENYVLKDTLLIGSNADPAEMKVPVRANVMLPPVMHISEDEFTFVAEDAAYTSSGSFTIDNDGGQSPLHYAITFKHQRAAAAAPSAKPAGRSGYIRKVESAAASTKPSAGISAVEGYNRTLEYAESNESDRTVGFGFGGAFATATRFQADDRGFNLSHVQVYYAAENLTVSPIVLEVYAGDDMANAVLLARDEYEFRDLGADYAGNLNLALTTPQPIHPHETFFVVVRFPFGSGHPQGTSLFADRIADTFLYDGGDGWYDITAESGFANHGWLVKALEKTFVENTWLTVNSPLEGTVAVDDMVTVNFDVLAANLKTPDAYATLEIQSNIPGAAAERVNVHLRMNQAPQFADQVYAYEVTENETLTMIIPVADVEGENMTLAVVDAPAGVTWEATDSSVVVTYAPGYLAPRVQTVNVKATDAGNRSRTQALTIHVNNVNRAPFVVDASDRHYDYASAAEEIATASIITDADTDDAVTVSASSSDATVVEVMASPEKIRIKPKKSGAAVLTIIMTDPAGAADTARIQVEVATVTGIETGSFGSVKLYPNPAPQHLNISLDDATVNVDRVGILDVMGHVLWTTEVNGRKHIRADVSGLAPGLYIVKFENSEAQHTLKFIKQ